MLYLDNAATTQMPPEVKKAMLEWCNRGNPSAGYASAKASRKMMMEFREYIGSLCGIKTCCAEVRDGGTTTLDPQNYKIVFTSGASEANCTALQMVVSAYGAATGKKPHIVMSAIEHKSLYEMAKSYDERGIASVTFIKPTITGHIRPADIAAAITQSTCIVCVMHANNETGAINDIAEIGAIAHRNNVVFHCDTAQTFGKFPLNPIKSNVDMFCVSFHKLHGPPGIGILCIKQQLLIGYNLQPMIHGTQNEGLRGGTENLPGIGASFAAVRYTMTDRSAKNKRIGALKTYIITELSQRMPTSKYVQYYQSNHNETKQQNTKIPTKITTKKPAIEIVFLSDDEYYLPNTILLSVVKRTAPPVCNAKLKSDLESQGIVVSVGSACNTASAKASHVLYAMGADEFIRKGALRITLGDDTTLPDAKKFVREFLLVVKKQM